MMDEISHSGIVTKIEQDKLFVTIISQSACSECHARGGCLASDKAEKEIEITGYQGHYQPGEQVAVVMRESAGAKAILFGYILPFAVLMVTLFIAIPVTGSEIAGGLIAIGMLVPYYIILFIFRKKLQKSFRFELKAI